MDLYAIHAINSNDIMGTSEKIKIGTKVKVNILDLCRPDIYMKYDIESLIRIWMWIKRQIKATTDYASTCIDFYYHSNKIRINKGNWPFIKYFHENMCRIFLGYASENGRWNFDKKYPLNKNVWIHFKHYKSHAPVEWGKSQRDILKNIIVLEKPRRLGWSPNSCHKKANVVYDLALCFDDTDFWWEASYDYMKELCSSWVIRINPHKKQLLLDYMMDIEHWIKEGMPRKALKQIDSVDYEFVVQKD